MVIIKQAEFFFLPLFFVFVGLMMGDGLKWKAEILRDGCVIRNVHNSVQNKAAEV